MGHIERRQKEKEEMRKSIMNAALSIAKKAGWEAVTIRKIASNVQYTPPIVYEYFKNKQDLLDALALMGFQMVQKKLQELRTAESDPNIVLESFSLYYWDFAFEHSELYQLMNSITYAGDDIFDILNQINDLFIGISQDNEVAKEQMFSWRCMQLGYINILKQTGIPVRFQQYEPKELYIKMLRQFISRL